MKFLKQGLCLALLAAGLAAVPSPLSTSASATPASSVAGDRSLVRDLRSHADGTLTIKNNVATGDAGFIRAAGAHADLMPGVAGDTGAKAAAKADGFIARYAAVLGARPGELVRQDVLPNPQGWTVRYTQTYRGLPVFGSMVKANLDSSGDLTTVNGYAAPDIDVATDPRFDGSEIGERAVAFVRADPPTSEDTGRPVATSGLAAGGAQLVVYRTGFVKGEPGAAVLAWAVEVGNGVIRDQLIYDAQTGKILNRYSMGTDALDRELYEASGDEDDPTLTLVWQEGDPFPDGLNIDQQNLVNSSGESYWLYKNAFGRDSYDGAGAVRRTVNNDPRIDCPNANWNGQTTNYCDGVTSDDVVAHEWGHAYTEYTSGLIYQYQSGALNESYSDVWGETVDLINGREDEGEEFTTKRTDGACDVTAPPGLTVRITAPARAAGDCFGVAATGAKPFPTTETIGTVVVATDAADADGPSTTDGCSAYTNAATVSGKWAYVDRGTCTFAVKVTNAKNAGATGIVIGNNNVDPPAGFTGDPALYGLMVRQSDGNRIKSAGGPVTMSVTAGDTSGAEDSTRWLIGEKSEAFGGAIRDMWTPTCYGDPSKVTDAEYKCDPLLTDGGGVHSNSGVTNHAYALAVDGGTFNGQTITGMGLDQAASIWWRAQTAYLVPSSNFTDFANALEASCADQVGKPITKLSTAPDAAPVPAVPVTTANCAELEKVITAVELRTPIQRCDFQPVLAKNTPSLCGSGLTTQDLYREDFEDGLAGWTPSYELAEDDGEPVGGLHAPWEATTRAPGSHPGGMAYGPAPERGQCSGDGVTDFSSRDSLTGPILQVPNGSLRNLRLSFDHYVATEATVDGGNVKLSVNGGDFEAIPADAYVFNAPEPLLTAAQGNTNPMAGEDAFSGTDGGEVKGSWGTSQVDLGAAGVEPGDNVQLRLDIGRDGCGGIDGWYVDNVAITVCKAAATVTAVHVPEPVAAGTESQVKVRVRRGAQTVGSNPTGTVVLRDPSGANVGEATLNTDGDATFTLPGTLPVGTHAFRVEYQGDDSFAPVSVPVQVTVTGAKVKARAHPNEVKRGRGFEVDVTVAGAASGSVQVWRGTRLLGSGPLSDGTVTIEVSKRKARALETGKNTLTATYLGAGGTVAGTVDFTVRVLRRR